MSFQSDGKIPQLDLWMKFGDHFSKTFTFPFNLTGYDFVFVAAENIGSAPLIELDTSDMTIVAGDPTSVTNLVTINIPFTETANFDFNCLVYQFQWVTPSNQPRTFVEGSLHGKGSLFTSS